MEQLITKAMDIAKRAGNSNIVINSFLFASFVALSVRSMNQQKEIGALEEVKDSLVKSNKAVRKTIWDWKQQLYADAALDGAVVPLSKLKAIYGTILKHHLYFRTD